MANFYYICGQLLHLSLQQYPFRLPSIDKWYPFHIPCLELFSPSTALNALSFKCEEIRRPESSLAPTLSQTLCIVHLCWALLRTEITNLPTISFTSTSEIFTLSCTWGMKKVPFSGWASPHWSLEGLINPQARQTIPDTKELGNGPLSHGGHFVSGDLKSFVKKPRSFYEACCA